LKPRHGGKKTGSKTSARQREAPIKGGRTAEGTVSANRAGYGFVRVEGLKDSVFLPPGEMRGLMHGDRVRVSLARDASDRWVGSVEQVLGRGVSAFLGTVEAQERGAWVSAADRRLQLRCSVAPADLKGARNGDWVIARILKYPSDGARVNLPPIRDLLEREVGFERLRGQPLGPD